MLFTCKPGGQHGCWPARFGPYMLGNRQFGFYLGWKAKICSAEIKSKPSIANYERRGRSQHPCSAGSPIAFLSYPMLFTLTLWASFKAHTIQIVDLVHYVRKKMPSRKINLMNNSYKLDGKYSFKLKTFLL